MCQCWATSHQISGGCFDPIIWRNAICNERILNLGHPCQNCHFRAFFFINFEVLLRCQQITLLSFLHCFQEMKLQSLENLPILKLLCQSLELLVIYFEYRKLNMVIYQFACTIFLYLPCEQFVHNFLCCLKCLEGRNGVNRGKRGLITRGKDISNPLPWCPTPRMETKL